MCGAIVLSDDKVILNLWFGSMFMSIFTTILYVSTYKGVAKLTQSLDQNEDISHEADCTLSSS